MARTDGQGQHLVLTAYVIADEVMSPEEWGEIEAAKAPPWTAEDRRRVAGILGLRLQPVDPCLGLAA